MLRPIFFLCLLLSINGLYCQQEPAYSKAKIYYNTAEDFEKLDKAGIPLDHGHHKRGVFIISDFSREEIQAARSLGMQVDIMIADAEDDFLKRNIKAKNEKVSYNNSCNSSSTDVKDYPTPTNFTLGSMGGYFTYQEVLDHLDAMKQKYPSLISTRAPIGNFVTNGTPDNSVSPAIGGNTIQWVRISDNPETDEFGEPEILYNAIHHAREPAGLSQLIYYMWYLLENYESDAEVKNIVDTTELYFVPVVNPDGYLYNQKTNPNGGGLWRKNRFNTHGVDLNRNYDHYTNGTPSSSVWATSGTSSNTSSDVYPGTAPFSEVETQAMKWFMEQHEFQIALNNHTSGDLLLLPYGYANNKPTPDNSIYQLVSEEMVSQNGFNNMIASELYPAAGDSDDFMYGGTTQPHNKVFAFTPEIGPSFWPASNQIDGIAKSMMYLNLTAAKITHNYAKLSISDHGAIGENRTINASYQLKRLGLSGDGSFTVSVTPLTSTIESVGTSKIYSNMTVGTSIDDVIVINLQNSIQQGDLVRYSIDVDGGLFSESITVEKRFGTFTTIIDNAANTTDGFLNSGWGVTNSTFVSPGTSLTESPSGNYGANQNKTIELDETVDLTDVAAANISFYAKWDIEEDWDYAQFEISVDDGASWISQCGSYTNLASSNGNQPANEPVYDGSQTDWVKEQIDLKDYLGEIIKVRFQFVSDERVQRDGFYFDDLQVNIISDSTLDIGSQQLQPFTVFPNPTKNILSIRPSDHASYSAVLRNVLGQKMLTRKDISGPLEFDLTAYAEGLYFLSIYRQETLKSFKIQKN